MEALFHPFSCLILRLRLILSHKVLFSNRNYFRRQTSYFFGLKLHHKFKEAQPRKGEGRRSKRIFDESHFRGRSQNSAIFFSFFSSEKCRGIIFMNGYFFSLPAANGGLFAWKKGVLRPSGWGNKRWGGSRGSDKLSLAANQLLNPLKEVLTNVAGTWRLK